MSTDLPQMGSDGGREVFAASEMDEFPLKQLTEKVIGAAMEVHKHLGSGFLEKIYENALQMELASRGLKSTPQG